MSDNPETKGPQIPGTIATGTGVLVLIVVVLLQYLITRIVEGFGGNPNIVSYVGFAGTIISIILAVLAIVYSYFQSFAQQRESYTLAGQIDVLRTTVESVRVATQGLGEDLDRMAQLNDKLDRSISVSEESRSASVAMRSDLKDFQEKILQRETASTSPRSSTEKVSLDSQARELVRKAVSSQRAVYYALLLTAHEKLPGMKGFDRFIKPVVPKYESFVSGFYSGTLYTLLDLGMVVSMGASASGVALQLHPAFEREVREAAPGWSEPVADTFLDVAAIMKGQEANKGGAQGTAGA